MKQEMFFVIIGEDGRLYGDCDSLGQAFQFAIKGYRIVLVCGNGFELVNFNEQEAREFAELLADDVGEVSFSIY